MQQRGISTILCFDDFRGIRIIQDYSIAIQQFTLVIIPTKIQTKNLGFLMSLDRLSHSKEDSFIKIVI